MPANAGCVSATGGGALGHRLLLVAEAVDFEKMRATIGALSKNYSSYNVYPGIALSLLARFLARFLYCLYLPGRDSVVIVPE